jgi:molecular chaperone GrpE
MSDQLNDEKMEQELDNQFDTEIKQQANESEESSPTIELNDVEKLQVELAEQKDKFLRLYSEFENFRKRTAKERLDLISTANEGLILSILPVVDDMDRALKSMEDASDIQAVKDGVQLISEKFNKILSSKGLEVIETELQTFDTELHEAITQIPAPTEDLKGKIVDCVEKGYKLGEKVIRYSKVVIGS